MLGVLTVHTIARFIEMIHTDMTPGLLTLGTLITSLHYTRESFMFITGLVLFITYYPKEFQPLQFWRKRLTLVAIPYVVWNIIYILFRGLATPGSNWSLSYIGHEFLISVLTGKQFYLYFIMVSIQFYVIFPFLLWALKKLQKWHMGIFIGSFVLELIFMYLTKFYLPHVNAANLPGLLSVLDRYRETFILTYQFWFVSGGIIACNYQSILAFVDRHAKKLWVILGFSVLFVWGHYLVDRLVLHESEGLSQLVVQPIMIPYALIVTLSFWMAGIRWSRRRERPSWKRFSAYIQLASNTSFGMYLVQPIPLFFMAVAVKMLHVPTWVHYFVLLPLSILFVYLTSMFLSYWIGRIPWVAYIVGRKVKHFKSKKRMVSNLSAPDPMKSSTN